MKEYYEIMRDLREDKDLKQKDVAKIIKSSQQYYSKYEKGKYQLPLRHLVALAKFYKVSADYLLGFTDIQTPIDERKLTAEETAHMLKYKKLSTTKKLQADAYVDALLEK